MSVKCQECDCIFEFHSADAAALRRCVGCSGCRGFEFPKFKFVDKKGMLTEITTEAMRYHRCPSGQVGTNGLLWADNTLWAGEILVNGEWKFVGEFRTGREAKSAVIDAYKRQMLESASAVDFNSSASYSEYLGDIVS